MIADLTTLRVGGPAARVVVAESAAEVIEAVSAADAAGETVTVLGGGSNVVVSDEGLPGTLGLVRTRGVDVAVDDCAGAWVTVAAGEPWDDVVARAVDEGWSGIEALSGIPGLTGGTPIQNVGAYGQEVADTIARVTAYDRVTGLTEVIAAGDCGFGYRTSRFKSGPGRHVVLSVTLQLPLGSLSAPVGYAELAARLGVGVGERAPSADVREAVLDLRRGTGMVEAQVQCAKTQLSAELAAVQGTATDGVGAAEQGLGARQVAIGQGLSHQGAGDPCAVHFEAHHPRHVETVGVAELIQQCVVPGALGAEAEVVPDHHQAGAQLIHQDALDEVLRAEAGQGFVKAQHHQMVHPTVLQRRAGVTQRGNARWCEFGPALNAGEMITRMGLEAHHTAGQPALAGLVGQQGQHRLMAAVHTVEVADRQRAGALAGGGKSAAEDLHGWAVQEE